MRGRKPTPTVLKALHGNPGRRPLNDQEPQPTPGIPPCPDHLDDVAAQEWQRIAPELESLGLLTQVDLAALAAYCQAYSRWIAAEAVIAAQGITYTSEKGMIRPHPAVSIAKESMRLIREFVSEFGLSPASRTRIRVSAPVDSEQDLSAFARKRA